MARTQDNPNKYSTGITYLSFTKYDHVCTAEVGPEESLYVV